MNTTKYIYIFLFTIGIALVLGVCSSNLVTYDNHRYPSDPYIISAERINMKPKDAEISKDIDILIRHEKR